MKFPGAEIRLLWLLFQLNLERGVAGGDSLTESLTFAAGSLLTDKLICLWLCSFIFLWTVRN